MQARASASSARKGRSSDSGSRVFELGFRRGARLREAPERLTSQPAPKVWCPGANARLGRDSMLREIKLTVNGQPRSFTADDTTTLLDALRNHLDLKGARYGCGAEQCGACSVIIDGEDKPSCAVEVGTLEGRAITTVEGLGTPERPHPLQQAF